MKTLTALLFIAFSSIIYAQFPEFETANVNPDTNNTLTIGGYRYGTYKLRIQDRLSVSVAGEPELTVNEIIDRQGKINLIYVGEVRVADMTIKQAEEHIANEYIGGRILKLPNIRIKIVGYAPQEILLLGQVRKPGPYKFPPEVEAMDIVEAVARSGGLTEIANPRKVTVKKKTQTGSYLVYKIDLKELQRGLQEGLDDEDTRFYIQPGDIIYVPERII
jgi:polysaccharide export outer membrane protein